ncbi:dolichyl-phosphate-mannose--protein mannosyltransferase [Planomonospora venezuelensis]|uniref:Polyprenol-phosphate-mannose--protein mannosyltransferase n=1 Tax=Planomonospora venezuelensis TaxID=1999 RepID=A0A841CXM1_PLAVE|nr:phospholipid carrier-dependent glycosyltransferase [Planomonospora venezuelensis]MBB5962691.1 dolichyl-phosphate-mannose--protein O-mannosyl transferase [Planomonospora venezuelensis]GIN01626.1 phospholipid carrier-dependent glycosyltransferase [Planomonospora venezuelensis]
MGSTRERLVPSMPGSVLWGRLGPLLVAGFGAILRFADLGRPHAVMFDETYYAKDAFALLTFGVERKALGSAEDPVADRLLVAGDTRIWETCTPPDADPCPLFVAHPPLGKWLIAAGEQLFGMNPFGWRFAAAAAGVLSILILARTARRMTRSTLLGCLAGLLLALDGLHFVLSRTALLDVFLMLFVLAGFACLVVDRDRMRAGLADWYGSSPLSERGPWLGMRPWRIAAGTMLGAACAVKWSGVFFLVAFAVMSLVWDAGARRAVGLRRPYLGALDRDAPTALLAMALVPAVAYVASWAGWFASPNGWGRNWGQATSQGPFFFVFDSLRSWLAYHVQVLGFHSGLSTPHDYQSEPWEWPLLLRPVAFHWETPQSGCGADRCAQAVLGVGTPVIWYGALAALIAMIAWYTAARDWRAGAVLAACAAGWLPWLYYAVADDRTMYLFYALPVVPFMILAIVLAAGLVVGRADAPPNRRAVGAALAGTFALLVLANFWWLHPVLSAEVIPYEEWWRRMLTRGWAGPG